MSKVFKDEKIFNKFKLDFRFIFKDENFIEITKNHFNKNGSFAAFTLAFLQNRVGEKKVFDNVKINAKEWIEVFSFLYTDSKIVDAYNKLNLNPIISFENITKQFDLFKPFINKLIDYIKENNWSLNISDEDVVKLLTSAYGYIFYNGLDCKIDNEISKLLVDVEYDKKYTMILNNTKLFSQAKNHIRKYCEQKINDLIVILLGGSNHLALIK